MTREAGALLAVVPAMAAGAGRAPVGVGQIRSATYLRPIIPAMQATINAMLLRSMVWFRKTGKTLGGWTQDRTARRNAAGPPPDEARSPA